MKILVRDSAACVAAAGACMRPGPVSSFCSDERLHQRRLQQLLLVCTTKRKCRRDFVDSAVQALGGTLTADVRPLIFLISILIPRFFNTHTSFHPYSYTRTIKLCALCFVDSAVQGVGCTLNADVRPLIFSISILIPRSFSIHISFRPYSYTRTIELCVLYFQ